VRKQLAGTRSLTINDPLFGDLRILRRAKNQPEDMIGNRGLRGLRRVRLSSLR